MEEGKGVRTEYDLVLLFGSHGGSCYVVGCGIWAATLIPGGRCVGRETGAFHSTSGEAVGSFGTCILYHLAP